DFGLSKRIESNSVNSASKLFGVVPYIDPKGFGSDRKNKDSSIGKFKLNKKSDVYSVGVIFWELSSGKKPFADNDYDIHMILEISRGLREDVVEGTPKEYSKLYK
ncbi:12111_t:CDS:1, partial [Funneliformis geosporum]